MVVFSFGLLGAYAGLLPRFFFGCQPINAESSPPFTITSHTNDSNTCPPTVPTTPIPSPNQYNSRIFSRNAAHAYYCLPPSPPTIPMKHKFQAPIIAPPPFELIPRKPGSAEDAA